MNKYKINYSVTIEAETQQDAVNIFFNATPQDGDLLCSPSTEMIGVINLDRVEKDCVNFKSTNR